MLPTNPKAEFASQIQADCFSTVSRTHVGSLFQIQCDRTLSIQIFKDDKEVIRTENCTQDTVDTSILFIADYS